MSEAESAPADGPAHLRGAEGMRRLMAGFPTGVGIVTTFGAGAQPWGMTCTSLASVALDPPILVVCLRSASPTLRAVLSTKAFAVNLLRHGARSTAELFASGDPDRFDRVRWTAPASGSGPHLPEDAHAVADCTVLRHDRHGDHVVLFGEVRGVQFNHEPEPLLYGLRRYASWPTG
jgi:flavin reductase (NADH)